MKILNYKTKLVTILGLITFCLQAVAKPPSDRMIVGCEGAYATIPFFQPASTAILTRLDSGVLKYFLTENATQPKNIEYFLTKNEIQDYIVKNHLENNVDAILNIIASRFIYIYTHDPVSNYSNFFGGLAQVGNGKEIRMLYSHQNNTLNVMLFDAKANQIQVNWVFRNCKGPNY